MEAAHNHPVEHDDAERIHRYIYYLTRLIDLPGIGRGTDPMQIVETLLDALVELLHLDFIYVRPEWTARARRHLNPCVSQRHLKRSRQQHRSMKPLDSFFSETTGDRPSAITVRFGSDDFQVVP